MVVHSPAKFDVLRGSVIATDGTAVGGAGGGHEQTGVPPDVADAAALSETSQAEDHHDFDAWDGEHPPWDIRVEDQY